MNRRIDFTQFKGFPGTQGTLDFMQKAYSDVVSGLAAAFGANTIISGCVVAGGFISDGWVCINGELLPFAGGSVTIDAFTKVIITETKTAARFKDDTLKDVYFMRRAQFGLGIGDTGVLWNKFRRVDLDPWKTGDVKDIIVTPAYIAVNFESNGIGKNERFGWALLDGQGGRPNAMGRVAVGYNALDPDFDLPGETGGSKGQNIQKANLPPVQIDVPIAANNTSKTQDGSLRIVLGSEGNEPNAGPTLKTANLGSGEALSIVQPYLVTVKIIKL
ncbi:MAG: hypothetical protein QM768_21865 [Agriterribacter sp.]